MYKNAAYHNKNSSTHLQEAALIAVVCHVVWSEEVKLDHLNATGAQVCLEALARPTLRHHNGGRSLQQQE
jgi:hypothetical protein